MIRRRRLITGDENDVHTRWRHLYVYLKRAGATAAVKRRTNRRERREGRDECREMEGNDDGA